MNVPIPSDSRSKPPKSLTSRLRTLALIAFGFVFSTLGALFMLLVAAVTLFQARRLYSEVIAKRMGQFALWMCGVRMVIHREQPWPEEQTIYISNHTSTLDVFVIIAMGLPNSRFFMFGKLRRILPIWIIGYLIGIFWTVSQDFPEKRRQIFQRAERVLRRTGESVYLSPEGQRVLTGEVGHFNRGAFHLATSLQAPIQPFYIQIPDAINPGLGLVSEAGVVDVYFMPPVNTAGWKVEDVDQNRLRVRQLFVEFHSKMQQR